jgi:hypothetical protein
MNDCSSSRLVDHPWMIGCSSSRLVDHPWMIGCSSPRWVSHPWMIGCSSPRWVSHPWMISCSSSSWVNHPSMTSFRNTQVEKLSLLFSVDMPKVDKQVSFLSLSIKICEELSAEKLFHNVQILSLQIRLKVSASGQFVKDFIPNS